MKHAMKLGLGLAAALALATVTGPAHATGLVVDAKTLPAAARASLEADVARAHAEVPVLFTSVADIAAHANALDAASRKPGIPFTPRLKALGPRALMPMLEMLAVDARVPADLTDSARSALRLGLLEAVGIVRDGRAVPVLASALAGARDAATTRASAEALARIGDDAAFGALRAALAKATGEREVAILSGLGSCRREAAARILADRLAAQPDEATARVLAKALGTAGNAWAWKTLSDRREEAATRRTAAEALVKAFVAYSGEARTAAAHALLVVDDPSTASLVAAAKRTASGDTQLALDELAQKLAKNPIR